MLCRIAFGCVLPYSRIVEPGSRFYANLEEATPGNNKRGDCKQCNEQSNEECRREPWGIPLEKLSMLCQRVEPFFLHSHKSTPSIGRIQENAADSKFSRNDESSHQRGQRSGCFRVRVLGKGENLPGAARTSQTRKLNFGISITGQSRDPTSRLVVSQLSWTEPEEPHDVTRIISSSRQRLQNEESSSLKTVLGQRRHSPASSGRRDETSLE